MKRKLILVGIILILISIPSATAYYFYTKYQESQKIIINPTLAAKEETQKLVAQIGKLMELPKNEEPTIATIIEKDKLKDQPFFKNAQNGDKVLIYAKEKKAILFNPKTNKIVEVSPINLTPQNTQQIKISLLNGTKIAGITDKIEKSLKDQITNINIVSKDNAKGNYGKTIVIDLTGNLSKEAETLASYLGGTASQLPSQETKPKEAELLVIIGDNLIEAVNKPVASPTATPSVEPTVTETKQP